MRAPSICRPDTLRRYAGLTVTRWCESWSRGGRRSPWLMTQTVTGSGRGVAAHAHVGIARSALRRWKGELKTDRRLSPGDPPTPSLSTSINAACRLRMNLGRGDAHGAEVSRLRCRDVDGDAAAAWDGGEALRVPLLQEGGRRRPSAKTREIPKNRGRTHDVRARGERHHR